jgi:coatomer subunit beta
MWAEFEWENKVAINTSFKTLRAFLDHIVKQTNMTCLTPLDNAIDTSQDTFAGEPEQKETTVEDEEVQTVVPILQSNFLAANLYARSVFGKCVFLLGTTDIFAS